MQKYYTTSFSVDQEHDKMLDELAASYKMSRSECIREIIGRAYMALQIVEGKPNG